MEQCSSRIKLKEILETEKVVEEAGQVVLFKEELDRYIEVEDFAEAAEVDVTLRTCKLTLQQLIKEILDRKTCT